jgi:hypothetical protein
VRREFLDVATDQYLEGRDEALEAARLTPADLLTVSADFREAFNVLWSQLQEEVRNAMMETIQSAVCDEGVPDRLEVASEAILRAIEDLSETSRLLITEALDDHS